MKKIIAILLFIITLTLLTSCGECKHDWQEATCTSPKTCSLCKATEGDPSEHNYSEWKETISPGCETEGEKKRTCSCGETETQKVTAIGHSLETYEAKPATCTQIGWEEYEACTRCNYSTLKIDVAIGHSLTFHEKQDPTCTEIGWTDYKSCSDCDFSTYLELEATGHSIVSRDKKDPTCTEIGWEAYEFCSNCDHTTYSELEATGHSTVPHVAKEPTCTEVGWEAYETCSKCDHTTYVEIKKLGHDAIKHEKQEATCTENGWEEYFTCSRCDYSTTFKEIPMGHKYTSIVTPPTCLNGGYTTHTCSECGDTYKDAFTDPTGHTMGNWYQWTFITKDSDDAEMRSDCLNCDIYETKKIGIVAEGDFGASKTSTPASNARYKLFEDGTLKISGTGETFSCVWNGSAQPYINYRSDVKKVIICEGITSLSGANFAYFNNLETVEFPSTLTSLMNNVFMDSFKKGITSITIPASVSYIGTYCLGNYDKDNATFTDIIFENPNINIYQDSNGNWKDFNFDKVINRGNINSELRIYSYGTDNKVKQFADAIGATYIDLDTMVSGAVDNLKYIYFNGKLEFSAIDPSVEAILPATMPWLAEMSNKDVKHLIIGEGIVDIPADYFRGYTALESIKLPESLESIGSMAFATMEACNKNIVISLSSTIKSLGEKIFNNRSGITINAFYGTAADTYTEDGVTVNLRKSFRLLLIGNSLSLDGADCSSGNTPSKLYEIIKAMLGENSFVQIGTLYSGAKSATWHATMAETNQAKYSFMVISDDTNGLWKVVSNAATTQIGLSYADWDCVTIQPYGSESGKGIGSMQYDNATDMAEKDEKFLSLSASLPYLLDHIETYNPGANIYYYNTWASIMDYSALNLGAQNCVDRLNVAKESITFVGPDTQKGFAGYIPAGTSIQNARTTYLGLLNYEDGNKLDVQKGLQRDNVHLSLHVGRYIAGLTIAEFVVPKEMRENGYTLPMIADSDTIGELPEEYTLIARLAVQATVNSGNLTGSAQHGITTIPGYTTDPAVALTNQIRAMSFANINATTEAELKQEIIRLIQPSAKSGTKITVVLGSGGVQSNFTATVVVTFGYTSKSVTISGTLAK